ncbi:MAG: hypothetical protein HZY78_01120 [Burkholderiaceae bacterium]|nr:MAG: hypothetical protein HZY78_01120 [Burkholderiaceae bacterium]
MSTSTALMARGGAAFGRAAGDVGHVGRGAPQGREPLGGLHADEGLHGFAEQVGLVHAGFGELQRALVERVVEGDGGSHAHS